MSPYRPLPERFRVAFSFAGAQRKLIRAVAERLEQDLGTGSVFFDEWFEYYIAGNDADLRLQNIYHQRADVVIVCVSADYNDRPWTRIEHRAIRALMMSLGSAEPASLRCLPIRVGAGEVDGVYINAIVPNVRERSTDDIAHLIRARLAHVLRDDVVCDDIIKESKPAPGVVPLDTEGAQDDVPKIKWRTYVGRQAWKNSPIILGWDVYIATAGDNWNCPDKSDGVYCLSVETGAIKWFAHTTTDANAILVTRDLVLTGCDDGSVVALNRKTGSCHWATELDSGIVAGPVLLDGHGGQAVAQASGRVDKLILVVTYQGELCVLDLVTGRRLYWLSLGCRVIGSVEIFCQGGDEYIAVPTISGKMVLVRHDRHRGGLCIASTHTLSESLSLAARPVFHDGKIILGTVGKTYAYFPIAAMDVATGDVAWRAADVGMAFQTGNVRSAPLVVGDEVVFTCAYSDGLFAVSLANGEYRWRVRLGQEMFEQWSGPIVRGNGLYLGRHDGYLHKVDMSTKKRVWSIYLGDDAAAGTVIAADQKGLKLDAPAAWRAGQSAPILATPRIDRGRLYVGTDAGYLYSIEELGF